MAIHVKEYLCRKVAVPVALDGDWNNTCWGTCETAITFLDPEADNSPVIEPHQTQVRAMWDEDNLYISFLCMQDDIRAQMTERDSPLFEENVAEVFIDPSCRGENYLELEVNPLGTILDILTPSPKLNDQWRKWAEFNLDGLKVAVRVEGKLNDLSVKDEYWVAQLAIPFRNFKNAVSNPPVKGDRWRINFCRYDYSESLGKCMLSSWVPLSRPCFDLPAEFGEVVFME
jgi:hypothetical protein